MNRLRWMQVIALVLLGFSLAACQQAPAKISGTIQLVSNSTVTFPPIEVRLMDTRQDQNDPKALVGQVKTEAGGRYEFTNVKPGTYSLGITAAMPPGVTCNPPSLLRIEQWLIGASYITNAQGVIEPTLLAVWDAPITAESEADLHFDLEVPVPCQ